MKHKYRKGVIYLKVSLYHLTVLFLLLLAMAMVINTAIRLNPDNDMWWMMSTGRYIIENGCVPKINPFTIHEEFHIIVQQWMLAVINYLLYSTFGTTGLIVLAIGIYMAMLCLVWKYTAFFTKDNCIRAIATAAAGIIGGSYLNTRPTLFTICVLLLQQIAVLKHKETKNKKWLWFLPALSVLLINLHASLWPFFFVLLLPHVAPPIWQGKKEFKEQLKEKSTCLLPAITAMLAGMLNPNGLKGMLYLFYSYNSSNLFQVISELQAPAVASFSGLFIIATIIGIITYFHQKGENAEAYIVYMAAGVVILSSMHLRNTWFILFGLLPLICILTGQIKQHNIIQKLTAQHKSTKKSTKKERAELILSAIVYSITLFVIISIFSISQKEEHSPLPIASADYLDINTEKEEVKLYAPFNLGGYLQWRGYKTYMDARPEIYMARINGKENIAEEYYNVFTGTADYEAFIEKYNFTHILVEKYSFLSMALKGSAQYECVIEESHFLLYEKTGQ